MSLKLNENEHINHTVAKVIPIAHKQGTTRNISLFPAGACQYILPGTD